MNKTIVLCTSCYLPHLGGVEIYTRQLAHAFSSDCKVIIITMNTHKQPSFYLDGDVGVYSLPCISLFNGRLAVPLPLVKNKIKKVLKDSKADFVLIQTRLYPFCYLSAACAGEMKLPAVIIEHGTGHVGMGAATRLSHGYEHLLMRLIRTLHVPFAGVSKASCNWLKHFNIYSDVVFYNSITPELLTEISSDSFKRRYGFSDDAFIIAFAGRLIHEKGVLLLAQAFKQVRRHYPNVILVIAGDGPLESTICSLAGDGIVCLGRLTHKETIAMLLASNVFSFPTSYSEGMPTVVLEAAICKCGIIATDVGGIPEVIIDKISGLLIPTGDVDALEDALRMFCSKPALAAEYAEAAYRHVIENFIWDITAQKVLSYIETVTEGGCR